MRGVVISRPGGPESLQSVDVEAPRPGDDEVVIDVVAAGVNRADIVQREGNYPPPPGASMLPGLEVSGRIAEVGSAVTAWSIGDEVCALVEGGGYAERVRVRSTQVLPVPRGVSLSEAAALPEAACTVWSNIVTAGRLRSGEHLLVHGGASGIGTFAIQLARSLGARVSVTVGSDDKVAACRALGADQVINYRTQDFVSAVRGEYGGGVDVILDMVGAPYLAANLDLLKVGGRLVLIGLMGGTMANVDLNLFLAKRLTVVGTTLRARPAAEKAAIVAEVRKNVWPLLAEGRIRPVVHGVHPLDRAADAHREMESSAHVGKLLLAVS